MAEDTAITVAPATYAEAIKKEKENLELAVEAAIKVFEEITGTIVRSLDISRTWDTSKKSWVYVSVTPRIEI
ncbi:MAG TPA: hypothetical protein PKN48_01160 [Bacteroidales bacterium]|nr:hypothetical protein [Bacteroidales bacterium]